MLGQCCLLSRCAGAAGVVDALPATMQINSSSNTGHVKNKGNTLPVCIVSHGEKSDMMDLHIKAGSSQNRPTTQKGSIHNSSRQKPLKGLKPCPSSPIGGNFRFEVGQSSSHL